MDYFPKWKYHATSTAVIVQNEAEEVALGDEWGNSPAEFATDKVQADSEDKPRRGRPRKQE
jgi:hypothetical protein